MRKLILLLSFTLLLSVGAFASNCDLTGEWLDGFNYRWCFYEKCNVPYDGLTALQYDGALRVAFEPRNSGTPAGPGMLITFQSCGYQAFGLNVACQNTNSGQSSTKILGSADTSPAACASLLYQACTAVGYQSRQEGNSVRIFGKGIKVTATGPVFTATEF